MLKYSKNYAIGNHNPISPLSTKASDGYTPGFSNLVNFGRSRRSLIKDSSWKILPDKNQEIFKESLR